MKQLFTFSIWSTLVAFSIFSGAKWNWTAPATSEASQKETGMEEMALLPAPASTETIATGSFIINMGITPQTNNNGLRPYGMIYDLLKNYQVPIKWVIDPNKGRDGTDFTHNGITYRGGPFIIPAEYRTPDVNSRITYWQGQGVVGATTVSPITVPVYGTIKAAPRWAINPEKPDIAIPYLEAASIPSTAFYVRETSELGACDDIFLIPHDDGISSANLSNWNNVHKGYIWVGCKSGSVMENNIAKFLSTTGVIGYGDSWGNPSVTYSFNADPPMQFLGNTAHQQTQVNGANKSYGPNASWRPTTRKLIHITNNERSAMVYGPGLGDINRGWVMMSGGHDYNKNVTSTADRVALIRAMLNFSYMSVLNKAVEVTMNIPDTIPVGVATALSYSLSPAGGSYSTLWTSSCGGTFSPNATSASVTFTPPSGPSSCVISVQVTDACGRVAFDSKQVTIGCVLSVQRTATAVSCNGGANGAINMTITGGSAPYSWSWSRVSPAGTGSGTGTSITGLSAGTYNVTVSSPAGCSSSFSILVSQPSALTATLAPINVSCFGQSTGAINLTPNGGTPGYSYSWSSPGGFTATTQNISGLAAGTYTVTVTDSQACTGTATATITAPASAVAVVLDDKTDVACAGGNTGAINITASGGTPTYTYAWSDGGTTEDRSGLAPGTYSVTVTDANGCTAVLSGISINVLQNTSLTIQSANPACFGGSNGSIQVTATGVSPFNIAWTGPSSGNPAGNEIATSGGSYTIATLSAGTYNVTVTDANNCPSIFSRTLSAPAALTATPSAANYLCFGQTGSINLSVNGGTPGYTYSWMGPGGFMATTQNISGLLAGSYNVTVSDDNNCTATASATITGPAAAVAVALDSKTDVACFGGSNGAINITASGGTAPYTYAWSDGATGEDRTSLSAGDYTVTVTDANGCTSTLLVSITQPPALTLSVSITDPTCPPGANPPVNSDGAINLTVTGGTGPFSYAWTTADGAGLDPTAEDQSGLTAGTYSVTVTDANGCMATLSVTLTNLNPLPTAPGVIIINN